MKAKLLKKFRQRYEVVAAKGRKLFAVQRSKGGPVKLYSFKIIDHKFKEVHYYKEANEVANFVAYRFLGLDGCIRYNERRLARADRAKYWQSLKD